MCFSRRPVAEDSQGFSPTPPSAARACVCSTQRPPAAAAAVTSHLVTATAWRVYLSWHVVNGLLPFSLGFTRGALSNAHANGVCIQQLWESLTHFWKEVNVNVLTRLMICPVLPVCGAFSLQQAVFLSGILRTYYFMARDNDSHVFVCVIKQVFRSCQSCFRVFPRYVH